MSPSKTKDDEPKLTLPVGHPQAGYVEPDLSYHEGTGILPDEEIDFHEARNAAREADVEAVAAGEHEAATKEAEAREESAAKARERLEKVASGELTLQQSQEAAQAQSALDATEDTTTTTKTSTPKSSS